MEAIAKRPNLTGRLCFGQEKCTGIRGDFHHYVAGDWKGYNGIIMTGHHPEVASITELCANVKRLGYGASQRVRLYGQDFEVVSDPFPDADGISVHAKTEQDDSVRVVRLPSTILQSFKGRLPKAA
jgi:hypothetical protein